eukprot:scaffold3482_cov128-Skeletonema_marinoi.AAC.3
MHGRVIDVVRTITTIVLTTTTQPTTEHIGLLCCLNIYYEKLSTMATQRDGTSKFLSQADSLAASLSDWIEATAAQTSAPHHRPFSPHPPPDFPSGTLRRRNNYIYNDGNGNSSNDRAISSRERVISLRTSPRLLHEEEPHLNRQSPNGITLKSSPSCVHAVLHREYGGGLLPLPFAVRRNEQTTQQPLHRESSTRNGGGMLPLPFAVRRNEQTTQQPPSTPSSSGRLASPHLNLNHQQQVGEVPSARSAPSLRSKSKRATRGSRRHSDPGTTLPISSEAGNRADKSCVSTKSEHGAP